MACRSRRLLAQILIPLAFLSGCATPPSRTTMKPDEPAEAASPANQSGDPMVAVNTLIDAPEDYALVRIDTDEYPVPAYAQYLKGVRICLDPGHGGQPQKRGYKRGPTGVREAEMNLRVAKYLRDFLEYAGAEVLLTRESDVDLSLAERAQTANDWGADIFISCHHNAIDNKPQTNRTTVWYHGDVDRRPSDLDLARYLCQGLLDGLALEQVTGIPLKSDSLMYESGFGVLRHAQVTAALTESSFYTNPEEEQRLRDPAYNLREAHALFLGLARYAFAGLPRATLIEPQDGHVTDEQSLPFRLDDGLRKRKAWGAERQMILTDSVAAYLDGKPVAFDFDAKAYLLTVHLPEDLTEGKHAVDLHFENMSKNSVLNPHFDIVVGDRQ